MLTLKGLRNYNRYQAALGHTLLSLIVFGILGYLVFFCWYPQPLFDIDAGWQGMRILACVDFILGPVITLFIFNPKKKELVKDLAIIALIQISALSYGTYHVYQSRPALIVYADNGFRTVALSQLEYYLLPDEVTNDISAFRPSFYVLDIPRDNIIDINTVELTPENLDQVLKAYDVQTQALKESSYYKTPYFLLPERLKPYTPNLSVLQENTVSIEDLVGEKNLNAKTFIEHHKNAFAITALEGRFGNALVAINKDGQFIDHLEGEYLNHWLRN